ncbi:MAG: BatD family protein [Pseudomonadales bacterium]|nr:BatD family protein [Halioglobus sp.]MCP5121021.1 BatD family protein [Pseudomonadales bacterium]
MTRRVRSAVWRGSLLMLLVSAAAAVYGAAMTPSQLVADGRLEVDARLATTGTIVPGQKLTLVLKIATDRWFSGGTRISLPEVPGLVTLQTEQFAANASERRGDQDWVVQRWSLDVYPQRAGVFTVPPITARVQVNAGEAGDVEGTIRSPAVEFTVTLPAALADVAQWVAAPEYTVSQIFDRSLENLQVGDAFEREIVFEASDVMAMMLPTVAAGQIPGLAAYPAPPVLDNTSNRGQVRASRRQRISYVVEAGGQYQLPAMDFFWWDTSRGELQVLSLPATEVSAGAGAATGPEHSARALSPRQLLLAAAGIALLAGLFWLARRFFPLQALLSLRSALTALRRKIHTLRQPALPERLNPGGSAGE